MSASKPTFQGYGTPVVYLFDSASNLIIDLRPSGSGAYDIALEKFTYEFKEKEEDKCTIVLSSVKLNIMDDYYFYVGQTMKVAWGYLNGDISSPISLLIADTRERFTTEGFQVTIELTDNFSALSKNVNPGIVVLQKKLESFKDLKSMFDQPKQVDNVDPITYKKQVEDWVKARKGVEAALSAAGVDPKLTSQLSEEIVKAEADSRLKNIQQRTDWMASDRTDDKKAGEIIETTKEQYARMVELDRHTPGVLNALIGALGPDENFNWARVVDKEMTLTVRPEYGNHLIVTGHNPSTLLQNAVNKVSSSPKQVTGRDGQVITYDKRRAHNAPAIGSYTWKDEEGRFLEFTYDTNSKYSDDGSVLSQFTIDTETGAITRKDYIKEIDMDMMDPKEVPYPTNRQQILADATLADKLESLHKQGLSMEDYLLTAKGSHMGLTSDGRIAGYMYQGIKGMESPFQFGYRGESTNPEGNPIFAQKGSPITGKLLEKNSMVQDYVQAVDGVGRGAAGVPIVSVPTMNCPVDEESVENELKSLKQADGEQVKATAKVLGDPQLYSGVNVMLLGLGKRRSGKYFLTGVTHDINPGSGFICTLEGYLTSTQAVSIGTVTRTIEKTVIKDKATTIKTKKIKVSPNYAEIKARGYYLPTDFSQTDMEAEMFKADKDWLIHLPGTIYEVNVLNKKSGKRQLYKIKVPIDPTTGADQYPYKVFGEDLFFNLAGQSGDERDNYIRREGTTEWVTRAEYTNYK